MVLIIGLNKDFDYKNPFKPFRFLCDIQMGKKLDDPNGMW